MPTHRTLLECLRNGQGQLSKSERKVATAVLADPEGSIRSSMARLSEIARVSEPTVTRFCITLGCSGWSDFKLRLAQELAAEKPYARRKVNADDEVDELAGKIFEATMAGIAKAWASVDAALIGRAIDALAQARKIEFYGIGSTASVALDAHHKFFCLNVPTAAYTDILMQRMAASATHAGDVVVIFACVDGITVEAETAALARDSGATVIGMTAADSKLAELCHILLPVEMTSLNDIYTPRTSRIVYLTLVDILATGVTIRRGKEFQTYLKKVREPLAKVVEMPDRQR